MPAGTYTLRARLVGYAPASRAVTVAWGATASVDLTLAPQDTDLAEVVV